MSMLLIFLIIFALAGVTYTEKANTPRAIRLRGTGGYQGARTRAINAGMALRGKPALYMNGQRVRGVEQIQQAGNVHKPRTPAKPKAQSLAYTAPTVAAPTNGSGRAPAGLAVDFFEAILHVANAPYEGPNDALRQLRVLTEGGRTWDGSLIRMHQRMADPGDMRIDPFVNEHVLRAAAYAQAMVLELSEADAAMTALLNMTLAEINDRGLQVPNTR